MPERFSLIRAMGVGSLLSCLIPVMAHLSKDIVHASYMAIDFMPVAAVFVFFILVFVINTAVRAVHRDSALTGPELMVVYIMLIMCSSITTMGLGSQLLPIMAAPHHYASPENRWAELVHPYLPAWLVPGPEAASKFFIGLEEGESIPWGAWVKPLLGWVVFLAPAYFLMIAMAVMLRKQWVEREHLIFPLTALPMAMAESPEPGHLLGPFFRNRGMWVAFAIVFIFTSVKAMHAYFDFVPEIRLQNSIMVFRRTTMLTFYFSFPILGLAFLINKDLSFSLWFFNLLFLCVVGFFNINGVQLDENLGVYGTQNPIFHYLGAGAIMAFVLGGLYNARQHIRDVFARALGRRVDLDDTDEILSYRTAVWGSMVSILILWIWLSRVGLNPLIVPLYLVAVYLLFLGMTRIVSEGGLPVAVAATIAPTVVVSMLGVNLVGATGLMALALMYVWCADIRIFPMAEAAQGLKMIDTCPPRKRRGVFWAMCLALVISFIVSITLSLYLAYTYGGITLEAWFFGNGAKAPYVMMADHLNNPKPPSVPGYLLMSGGATVSVALAVLRATFSWFAFHPIGFAIGSTWIMNVAWLSIFLAWLVKSLILRYGGPRAYRQAVPFFLGVLMGQYSAAAFWFVVDLFTGETNNIVFWI
jgi:hypothetical protein